ncbi:RadC family protein [Candidatus Riflebacteria bacterium]
MRVKVREDKKNINFESVQSPDFQKAEKRLQNSGSSILSDKELLFILLGSDQGKNFNCEVIEQFKSRINSSTRLPSCNLLQKLMGIGQNAASRLLAGIELGKRIYADDRCKIQFPSDLIPYLFPYVEKKQEYLLSVSLNGGGEIIKIRVITKGLLNRTLVHPREVFCGAIGDRAASIIIAHNHPGGELKPGPEDRKITRQIKKAGEILGIPMLDHIIFNKNGYFSFLEEGELI